MNNQDNAGSLKQPGSARSASQQACPTRAAAPLGPRIAALVELREHIQGSLREARLSMDHTKWEMIPDIFDELCDAISALVKLEQTLDLNIRQGLRGPSDELRDPAT